MNGKAKPQLDVEKGLVGGSERVQVRAVFVLAILLMFKQVVCTILLA